MLFSSTLGNPEDMGDAVISVFPETHQSVRILLHFGAGLSPSIMDYGNAFPLMFGRLLIQATQLPHKTMEGMRLRLVHSAARSTHTLW